MIIVKKIGVLFIDFKKAFDSVDHTILLNKTQGKGLAGELHEWLTDYLHNRQQYTELNGIHSGTQIVKYGVPQGSLLGPRLFKIYVDDHQIISLKVGFTCSLMTPLLMLLRIILTQL